MYLYFDYKGTLLETVNDQALRQYNKGVNTVNIYIESEPDSATGIVPDDGKIPNYITGIQYWFQLANGDKLNNLVYEASNKIKKTIPFDRNRDLRHFKYGKSYEFFSFQVPSGDYKKDQNNNVIDFVCEGDVFKSSGLVLMTVQALTMRTNDDGTEKRGTLSLERVAFTVEDAVVLPEDIVSSSEFNWLLQQYAFGDYLRAQLVYMKVDKITDSHAFTIDGDKYSIDLDTSLFNRQPPKIGDAFLYIYEDNSAKKANITMALVQEVTGDVTTCSFSISDTIPIKGEKGEAGEDALVYYRMLDFEIVKGTSYQIEYDFNRPPKKGDTFIAYSSKSQCALFRVSVFEGVSTTATAIEVIDVKGEAGADGKDGLSTLIYTIPVYATASFGKDSVFSGLVGSNFNRIPVNDEIATVAIQYNKRSYLTTGKVKSYSNPEFPNSKLYAVTLLSTGLETTGATGATGAKGATGAAIVSTTRVGQDSEGGNIYEQVFDNGSTARFTAPMGRRGSDGKDGTNGVNGVTYTPSVADDGTLSWTNDGGKTNPKSVNIMGKQGQKGDTGAKIVSTVLTGQDTSGGNIYKQTFDDGSTAFFTAPKGTKGDKGDDGKTGGVGAKALEFDGVFVLSSDIKNYTSEGSLSLLVSTYESNFNRTPTLDDSFLALARYTYSQNTVYVVTATITGSRADSIKIVKYCDISGRVGATGATGVGISTATVTATATDDEYTTTTVTLTKTDSTTDTVKIKAKNGVNPNTVSYIGTALVSDWSDSTAYSAYGYKYSALLPFTGGAYATDTYVPDVVPSVIADIVSGNFAPFANSTTAGVEVYAKTKPTATTNFNVSLSHVQ